MLIKNDAIRIGAIGEIISRFERRGYVINDMMMVRPIRMLWEQHYAEHTGKDFFDDLISRMTKSGQIVALCVTGVNVIKGVRNMTGCTDASDAAPGTIRGDFGVSLQKNAIHTSSDAEAAERELEIWFPSISST